VSTTHSGLTYIGTSTARQGLACARQPASVRVVLCYLLLDNKKPFACGYLLFLFIIFHACGYLLFLFIIFHACGYLLFLFIIFHACGYLLFLFIIFHACGYLLFLFIIFVSIYYLLRKR